MLNLQVHLSEKLNQPLMQPKRPKKKDSSELTAAQNKKKEITNITSAVSK